MESIFDFNVKGSELEYLLIKDSKEEYLKNASDYKRFSDLFLLFKLRKDAEKANEYLTRLVK